MGLRFKEPVATAVVAFMSVVIFVLRSYFQF